MPIYAYKCESCGQAKDVLQKISDPILTECPFCGQASFRKQLTAAGFQLKGSGWYATDFKGAGAAPSATKADSGDKDAQAKTTEVKASDGKTDSGSTSTPVKSADAAPAPAAPAAAKGCASGCACH